MLTSSEKLEHTFIPLLANQRELPQIWFELCVRLAELLAHVLQPCNRAEVFGCHVADALKLVLLVQVWEVSESLGYLRVGGR